MKINGHEVIAVHYDYSYAHGVSLRATVLLKSHKRGEFITAWWEDGDEEWSNGHYFMSYENALIDFNNRVIDALS